MSATTSLEELYRHAVTFPGAGVALGSLASALKHVEEELERSAAQISLRVQAKHARLGDDLHPEDKEYEEYELERTTRALLPKIVRGGFILTLWSTFEVAALDIAECAHREIGRPLKGDPFRNGGFLKNLDVVFSKGLGIPAFPDRGVYERLDELRLFRHALVHHDGKVERLPATLRRASPEEYAAIGLHQYGDLRHEYVVPTAGFTRQALELVTSYLVSLSERVYAKLHPTPLTDA
jgi:hypothetical protein